jgi:predicted MPP superfamily phosphohydrolase
VNRRRFLVGGAALAGAGVLGYTWGVEPYWVEFVRRDLPVDGLPAALDGATLAQLSDLHVGPRVSDDYLVDVLRRTAALRPDFVAVTGDLLTHRAYRGDAQYAQLRAVLAHLPRGRLGTVAVLGNHDYGTAWRELPVAARVQAELERAGARVLRNDAANLAGLDFVGVDDLWSLGADARRALARRSAGAAVALCHNPDGADELAWGDYRGWILAGHTHGGQCKPPFLPPPLLPVRNARYAAGEVSAPGGRTLYISRGVGFYLHVRFNVRPEVTLFTLRRPGPGGILGTG